MIGISSWGVYIPPYRYALGDGRKGMALFDPTEDVITMGYEASRMALERMNLHPSQVDGVRLSCENTPYSVKPLSGIIKDLLGAGSTYSISFDIGFACLGGIQAIWESYLNCFISTMHPEGIHELSIGTDYSIYPENTDAELTQGSGAACFVISDDRVIATIEDWASLITDTPDFYRRDGQRFPNYYDGFTKKVYLHHVHEVGSRLKHLKESRFVVFHMPYGGLPREVARKLGLAKDQYLTPIDLITKNVGNAYTASVLIALAWALENAEIGDLITAIGYGSGAGSLGITFRIVGDPKRLLNKGLTVTEQINQGHLVGNDFYQHWRSISEPEYRLVGKVSPTSEDFLMRLVCPTCGGLYSSQSTIAITGKCPKDDSDVKTFKYPFEGSLDYCREIEPSEIRQAIGGGEIPILNNSTLPIGTKMKLIVRKLYSDGENGPIYHGAAYRPL